MKRYEFCLAWNWEYDHDFVGLLVEACGRQRRRLRPFVGWSCFRRRLRWWRTAGLWWWITLNPIDLRLQSRTLQGVPDVLVQRVAENLVTLAAVRYHTNLAQTTVA